MRTGDALMKLTRMGFRFRLDGEVVKVKFDGERLPDKAAASPLLNVVEADKDSVREFLRCYCPTCGGVVFVGDDCFICKWVPQAGRQTLGLEGEVARTCGGCTHFHPSHLNPLQGFGRCALEALSRRPGSYPTMTACPRFEVASGNGTLRLAQ
jgi:hypothetical protein